MTQVVSQSRRQLTRLSVVLLSCFGLSSCSLTAEDWRTIADRSGLGEQAKVILEEKFEPFAGTGIFRDIGNLDELIDLLGHVLEGVWGEDEEEVSSDKRLVKYSNDYQARAIVDFEQGYLQVETVATDAPLEQLEQALVIALLTPKNLTLEDVFTDSTPQLGEQPFLYNQVLDHDNQAIRYEWRAQRFARHLIDTALQTRRSEGRTIRSVRTALVADHLHLRSLQFSDSVLRYSRQYQIAPDLIYAVIEVESSFNPYAVSRANALGLMQIVPNTAGRDVFERIKRIEGEPSRDQLFVPDFNIDIGSAYLHLLDDVYLSRITNPQSRQFAAISAYNGGSGNVFRAFSSDRDAAIRRINGMTPEQVYQHLITAHPFAETRNYLRKVRTARSNYQS
ncbi:MAG: DUF3393 domain-containing protein [Idiomarina sp.]|nr:DUF3393 domain-containing protein [Idiomarina sp.]